MKRVFLLGHPVSHSVSPAMHNAAFRALGLNWEYEPLETSREKLREACHRLRTDNCAGANVTVPHKQAIMELLDGVSETARTIGAVNTITPRDGKLFGENTDAEGFVAALKENHINPRHARVVILGAGGAARAVAFALAAAGAREIILINRTASHATELADRVHARYPGLRLAINWREAIADANILINATSVGMWPNITDAPLPPEQVVSPHSVVVDLIYNPLQTRFLWDAKRAGAWTINGLGMLVHQGAASFKLWTGRDAPIQVMLDAARKELAK